MGTDINITVDHLMNISSTLNGSAADFSVEEQGLLCALFQAGGSQIHGEVSGFALSAGLGLGGTFASIFGEVGPAGAVVISEARVVRGVGDDRFVVS
jgi:hypothetical protein